MHPDADVGSPCAGDVRGELDAIVGLDAGSDATHDVHHWSTLEHQVLDLGRKGHFNAETAISSLVRFLSRRFLLCSPGGNADMIYPVAYAAR